MTSSEESTLLRVFSGSNEVLQLSVDSYMPFELMLEISCCLGKCKFIVDFESDFCMFRNENILWFLSMCLAFVGCDATQPTCKRCLW